MPDNKRELGSKTYRNRHLILTVEAVILLALLALFYRNRLEEIREYEPNELHCTMQTIGYFHSSVSEFERAYGRLPNTNQEVIEYLGSQQHRAWLRQHHRPRPLHFIQGRYLDGRGHEIRYSRVSDDPHVQYSLIVVGRDGKLNTNDDWSSFRVDENHERSQKKKLDVGSAPTKCHSTKEEMIDIHWDKTLIMAAFIPLLLLHTYKLIADHERKRKENKEQRDKSFRRVFGASLDEIQQNPALIEPCKGKYTKVGCSYNLVRKDRRNTETNTVYESFLVDKEKHIIVIERGNMITVEENARSIAARLGIPFEY